MPEYRIGAPMELLSKVSSSGKPRARGRLPSPADAATTQPEVGTSAAAAHGPRLRIAGARLSRLVSGVGQTTWNVCKACGGGCNSGVSTLATRSDGGSCLGRHELRFPHRQKREPPYARIRCSTPKPALLRRLGFVLGWLRVDLACPNRYADNAPDVHMGHRLRRGGI